MFLHTGIIQINGIHRINWGFCQGYCEVRLMSAASSHQPLPHTVSVWSELLPWRLCAIAFASENALPRTPSSPVMIGLAMRIASVPRKNSWGRRSRKDLGQLWGEEFDWEAGSLPIFMPLRGRLCSAQLYGLTLRCRPPLSSQGAFFRLEIDSRENDHSIVFRHFTIRCSSAFGSPFQENSGKCGHSGGSW